MAHERSFASSRTTRASSTARLLPVSACAPCPGQVLSPASDARKSAYPERSPFAVAVARHASPGLLPPPRSRRRCSGASRHDRRRRVCERGTPARATSPKSNTLSSHKAVHASTTWGRVELAGFRQSARVRSLSLTSVRAIRRPEKCSGATRSAILARADLMAHRRLSSSTSEGPRLVDHRPCRGVTSLRVTPSLRSSRPRPSRSSRATASTKRRPTPSVGETSPPSPGDEQRSSIAGSSASSRRASVATTATARPLTS